MHNFAIAFLFDLPSNFYLIVDTLFRVGQQILDQLSEIVLKFGQGEMEYIMTNEKVAHDLESIKIVAMTTPVIVKSRHLLRRYVKDLNVLFHFYYCSKLFIVTIFFLFKGLGHHKFSSFFSRNYSVCNDFAYFIRSIA